MRYCLAVIFVLLNVAGSIARAEVRSDLPSTIDLGGKYLFFLHGIAVELKGPDSYSGEFRKTYESTAIARTLAERGFIVIAETRPKGTKVPEYAGKLATQIRQLLAAGVPGRNIVVVGQVRSTTSGLPLRSFVMVKNGLPAIHPGEYLAETLEELDMSQAQFARVIGVSPMRVSHVVKGVRPVTAEPALLFGRAFEQTPQYWLNLQADFDLKNAEASMGARLVSIHAVAHARPCGVIGACS